MPVTSGIPHGSVLGPLLFVIYINDLPMYAKNLDCSLFANDAKLSRYVSNQEDSADLQKGLCVLKEWSDYWLLKVNIKSTTQQQPFYGPLSRTTQVNRYQKKHSPTHHPDHHLTFSSFLHLPRSIASSLFKLRAWQTEYKEM